jgi:hypothetical protein
MNLSAGQNTSSNSAPDLKVDEDLNSPTPEMSLRNDSYRSQTAEKSQNPTPVATQSATVQQVINIVW